jgi:NAD(P)-dependent dehydrogenase (short-subunit alcohol dehydrogenase family)
MAAVLHGWQVIGDLSQTTPLHHLAEAYPGRVRIEALDICDSDGIAALRNALADSVLDMLFVNAGTTNRDPTQTIGEIATEEFIHVMLTNALAPMRVIENLQALVLPQGLIGVMSSGQGSLSNNTGGQRELYRGSKAALNMFMRSFAARPASVSHPMVVMAPGWIRTALGGESAPLTMAETILAGERAAGKTKSSRIRVSGLSRMSRAVVISLCVLMACRRVHGSQFSLLLGKAAIF